MGFSMDVFAVLVWSYVPDLKMLRLAPVFLRRGRLAQPTTAFGRLNSAAVQSAGQGHSMWDGSSGRTIVKQGMTLRTRQRDLRRRKFQPWTQV